MTIWSRGEITPRSFQEHRLENLDMAAALLYLCHNIPALRVSEGWFFLGIYSVWSTNLL
jgi:hypothetical protein